MPPGMVRSMITRLNGFPPVRAARYFAIASVPSTAHSTSRPKRLSSVDARSRMIFSSSMNNTRPASRAGLQGGRESGWLTSPCSAGSQRRKVVPCPTCDSTSMCPECFLTME